MNQNNIPAVRFSSLSLAWCSLLSCCCAFLLYFNFYLLFAKKFSTMEMCPSPENNFFYIVCVNADIAFCLSINFYNCNVIVSSSELYMCRPQCLPNNCNGLHWSCRGEAFYGMKVDCWQFADAYQGLTFVYGCLKRPFMGDVRAQVDFPPRPIEFCKILVSFLVACYREFYFI